MADRIDTNGLSTTINQMKMYIHHYGLSETERESNTEILVTDVSLKIISIEQLITSYGGLIKIILMRMTLTMQLLRICVKQTHYLII